ncbi:hypothetical protein J15TS10_31230 [Paenibacillus woosongensis]|uniref:Uncharacterized protein n=1 Tax=Paenibacillus woosongensis TaxID=307580 RepID=A0ABQ4MTQ7_9BACL|nr:hypothetical protein J15TS10_31230 [Paenibacillus woosongensis]
MVQIAHLVSVPESRPTVIRPSLPIKSYQILSNPIDSLSRDYLQL